MLKSSWKGCKCKADCGDNHPSLTDDDDDDIGDDDDGKGFLA